MSDSSPLTQLSAKRRTYSDLSRFISSRTSGVPNYTFLLGAGCSVSSGVRSAGDLVAEWRKEVFERLYPGEVYFASEATEKLSKNQGVWYNPNREYSSLFEKNFDLPRQRRMFVEQEVSGKFPNLGYAYLIRLVDSGFINTLFTTNFDDLLTEAFFQFSQNRPMICAHDSAISSVTVTSSRPKIIKLHGDYLFDDIKSTVRETESLEENTRRKFVEFGRNFGLVVVGYSGCDRSIMDVVHYLLRSEDHFKHGIYWCIRKGEAPSDELIKLLWRDRVYFVEIDGFDELMGQLHNDLIGTSLPIDTRIVNDKPRTIISGFCENHYLRNSSSEVIKRDLEILGRQNSREELLSTVRDMKHDKHAEDDDLTDREMVVTLEVRQLIDASRLSDARERIRSELEKQPRFQLKERLFDLLARTEEHAGDLPAALQVLDDLIAIDPKDPDSYIRKSQLLHRHEERMRVLEQALSLAPFNHRVHNAILIALTDAKSAAIGFDAPQLSAKIDSHYRQSVECNPGLNNKAWAIMAEHLSSAPLPKDEVRKGLQEISDRCSRMDPSSVPALRSRLTRASRFKEDRSSKDADELLSDISRYKSSKPTFIRHQYEWLELDALSVLDRDKDLSRRISEIDVDSELNFRRDFLKRKAKHLMKASGDLDGAIAALRTSLKGERSIEDMFDLSMYLVYKKDATAISELLSDYSSLLRPLERHQLQRFEHMAKGNMDGALSHLRAMNVKRMLGVNARNEEIHDLLMLKKYDEAETIAKELLDQLGWSVNYAELIVNYELARQRRGEQPKRSRLNDVIERSDREHAVICANFLAGNAEKCKEGLKAELKANRENSFIFSGWAIFSDDKGKRILDAASAGA